MNKLLKYTALAAFMGAGLNTAALADTAETKGGITIKTDDGRFEAKVGGRIHFDGNFFVDDDDLAAPGETSSTFFRRSRLTLEGKAYGWKYKFEEDFADKGTTNGFREMWLGTALGGANLRIGQAKPYRGMEELTSSNEIVFMERPYATATGIYEGNQFTQGLFLDGYGEMWTWGVAAYNLRNASGPETDGAGFGGRATFAPVNNESTVVHLGLTASLDNPQEDTAGVNLKVDAGVKPAGRLSSTQAIASGDDDRTAYGLELAARSGPFYAQGEYVNATFGNKSGADADVTTYYVQASWLLTGEMKPYDAKKGVFKSLKPTGANGAWEAKVRYDFIENEEVSNGEVSQMIAGVNWYVNPNVRFMLEYVAGSNEFNNVDLSNVTARAQFSF